EAAVMMSMAWGDGDGGVDGVAVAVVGEGKWRVEESGSGDRIDPAMRNTFGLRRNTRRKWEGER
ncbi:hypothetical protein Tco_0605118, partial [Tanacetum coccineum]